MVSNENESKTLEFVRQLCVGCSEEEILKAEQNLKDYLSVVRDICNRLEFENKGIDNEKIQ